MRLEDMNYPFHIGVTEAGEGEDGRVKSAVGSGALLADGIGDTIRISLTEDPAAEIPFARKLVDVFRGRENHAPIKAPLVAQTNPFEYERRSSRPDQCAGTAGASVLSARRRDPSARVLSPSRFDARHLTGTVTKVKLSQPAPRAGDCLMAP